MTSQCAPTPPAPPAPEVKKKPIYLRCWFIALTVLLLIIAISSLSGDGDEATTATEPVAQEPEAAAEVAPAEEEAAPPEAQAPEPDAAPAAGIGTPVRDGQFEFVVTGIENVGTEIGDPQFLSETAQGEYLIVRVDVSNIGDEPRMFDAASQYLYDAEGSRYDASSDAYLLDDFDKAFLEEINPGNTVTAAPLLYDVPSGFVPASIELHDSLLSGGVTVTLQ